MLGVGQAGLGLFVIAGQGFELPERTQAPESKALPWDVGWLFLKGDSFFSQQCVLLLVDAPAPSSALFGRKSLPCFVVPWSALKFMYGLK